MGLHRHLINVATLLTVFVLNIYRCGASYTEINIPISNFYHEMSLEAVYYTSYANSIVSCAKLCFMSSLCKSFNYHRTNQKCSLNHLTMMSHPDSFISTPGSVYSDIDQWSNDFYRYYGGYYISCTCVPLSRRATTTRASIAGICGKNQCGNEELCFPGHRDNVYCIKLLACPRPAAIGDSTVPAVPPLSPVGSRANYTCDVPHLWTSTGDPEIECGTDGRWSETTYTCIACPAPPVIDGANYTIVSPSSGSGTLASYTCESEFHWTTGNPVIECLSNGQWSTTTFKCTACPSPPQNRSTSNTTMAALPDMGSQVTYTCGSENYWSTGENKTIQCLSTGEWSPSSFHCKSCGAVPSIQYTRVANAVTTDFTRITYECSCPLPYGESMNGSPEVYCTSDGVWSHLPTCQVDCFTDAQSYSGIKDTTLSGYSCQIWLSNSLYSHDFHGDHLYPDASEAAAGNKCRAPDGDVAPWCFTTSWDRQWEFCGVPVCAQC